MANFEVYLSDNRGVRIALLDTIRNLSYVRAANSAGAWYVTIPDIYPVSYIQPDNIIEIWREGKNEMSGLLRRWQYTGQGDDSRIALSGPSFLYLLDGRQVAYAAGESESAKSDFADDMIKEVIRENLGSSATDTARDLSGYNFTVQGDSSAGASIERRFSWRNVLDVCRDFAKESTQRGTRVYFDIIPFWSGTTISLEFQTFIGQRGQDRTYESSTPVVFGTEWGNISNPVLEYNYWSERNYAYVGGQGLGADRLVAEQSDTDQIAISPWNRREMFINATSEETISELQSVGQAKLDENKPFIRFSAKLLSVPGSLYGEDWGWGDKVVATHRNKQFDGHIDRVRVALDSNGKETIDAKIEVLE